METEPTANKAKILLYLLFGAGFVVLIILVTPWLLRVGGLETPTKAGEFADQYGLANALFSGLAFVGVIGAILLQKQELELQRKELEQTREELRGQKEQLVAQNKTLQQQRFENTFFELLKLHSEIVQSLAVAEVGKEEFKGRACFRYLYSSLRKNLTQLKPDADTQPEHIRETIRGVYKVFYHRQLVATGHYFRSFCSILRFIAQAEIDDPQLYVNLLRAQLSTYELLFIFYHCLSDFDPEAKPLIERFGVLESVDTSRLVTREHVNMYGPGAFKKAQVT